MILTIVQARMGSKRLPGKALASLHGQPMIWRQLERLRAGRCPTKIVVATSCEPSDDALASWLVSKGQAVFRGAPTDLLDRFSRCAASAGPVSHVVRIKGDAPFVDAKLVDEGVRLALASGADYVTNRDAGFPKGLEVEIVSARALQEAAGEVREPLARVSPTATIRASAGRFSQARFTCKGDHAKLEWRVKSAADLGFARSVYAALHPADPDFGMEDVLDLIGGGVDLGRYAA
jgi:spore coat polysaccharide biosynthesis protein SpsF